MSDHHPHVRVVPSASKASRTFFVELWDGLTWEVTHSSPLPSEAAERRARWLSDALLAGKAYGLAKKAPPEAAEGFFILSTHRTAEGPACVWWRPRAEGYTVFIGEAGRFSREEAIGHSDPPHHLAIPCDVVDVPASRAKALAKKALRESRFDPVRAVRDEGHGANCGVLGGGACTCGIGPRTRGGS